MALTRSPGGSSEELLIPLPGKPGAPLPEASHIRSTVLGAALLGLKAHGHLDAYLEKLPPSLHETVLRSVAGTWVDLSIGVAHYLAVDALDLPLDEQLRLGRGVSSRINDGLLGTAIRVAKGAGVTPWLGLGYVHKGWARMFKGGGVAVYRLGPKEARYEAHGIARLAEIPYFRNATRGMLTGAGELFCDRIYVRDVTESAARTVLRLRLMWA